MEGGTDGTDSRARQRADTHRRILAVALEEISANGSNGAQMAAIARRAGVSRQTVYAHFPSIDAVIAEVFDDYRDRSVALTAETLGDGATIELVLDALVTGFFDELAEESSHLREAVAVYLVRGTNAAFWFDEPIFHLVQTTIEREQEQGRLAARPAARDLAVMLFTTLGGFELIAAEDRVTRRARAREALGLIVEGCRPR